MEEVQISVMQNYLYNAIFGFVIGIIPLALGLVKRKSLLGIMGVVASTLGGGIMGVFLSVPLVAIFIWLILDSRSARNTFSVGIAIFGIIAAVIGYGLLSTVYSPSPLTFEYGFVGSIASLLIGGSMAVAGVPLFIVGILLPSPQNSGS